MRMQGSGYVEEGDHFARLTRRQRGVLKRIFNKLDGSVDWIDLAQDRDGWQALVSAVMNLRVS